MKKNMTRIVALALVVLMVVGMITGLATGLAANGIIRRFQKEKQTKV